jgi:1-acyl-sn-glycerol-3-phosphate acyltransferase
MRPVSRAAEAVRTCGLGAPWWVRATRGPLRLALWLALRLALRIDVEGIRGSGPAVIASNHPNLIDGLLVLVADPSMRPIARWHRYRVVRLGLWIGNCVITSIGTTATLQRGAYIGALAHLRRGGRVWIAPEGGWQPEVTLRPPRTGAVRLAHMAAVPIQVLAICHAPHPGPEIHRWPLRSRPRVVLRWGPCLTTTGDIAADGDRLMTAIAESAGMTWRPEPGQRAPVRRDRSGGDGRTASGKRLTRQRQHLY